MTKRSANALSNRFAFFWMLLSLLVPFTGVLHAKPIKLRSFSRIGGNFTLDDMHGHRVQLNDFNKKIVILYFGYTFCPDICPNTLFVMADALKQLGEKAQKVQILYVTLDPERDTGTRLVEYLSIFDSRILGLRGDEKETAVVAKKYVIRYRKKFLGTGDAYIINHTSYSFLIDQKGIIRYLYPYKTTPDFIARTVLKLLSESNQAN
ncbi:SCO family protein [bacterium]|nr:SCO family protein [bacterium]